MPNKKTKTVKIRHLECFSAIYGELAQNPEYAGYEIEEAVLQVKSYIPPAVKDVDKAIEKIRFSHATRKYKYPVFEQGTDRPKDIGENGGREQADRSPVGGTRFHIPFGHRLSGSKYFVIKEVVSQLERLKDVK